MMKNINIKLFIITALLFFNTTFILASSESNNLERITINPLENNTFNISLYFSNDFNTKAYIQKVENGFYYIYLPDTKMNGRNIKVNYKNKFDKKYLKLKTEEKPFKNKVKDSSYTRIALTMNSDYSLNLISKNIKDYKFNIMEDFSINIYSLIFIGFCLVLGILARKLAQILKSDYNMNSYTAFPSGYTPPKPAENTDEALRKNFKYNLNKTSVKQQDEQDLKQNIKTADNNSFKCFNIPLKNENNSFQDDFNSVIKKTSELLKEKAQIIKNKLHTNPINEKNPKQKENINKNYEILSIIKLDNNRGFYLSKENNEILLYGFIGGKTLPLRKFIDLPQISLQARFYDKNKKNDIFIVRVDSYKAMIEFSDTTIKELAII